MRLWKYLTIDFNGNRIYWLHRIWQNLVIFLQGAQTKQFNGTVVTWIKVLPHLSAQSLWGLMLTEAISGYENFGKICLKIILRNWTLNTVSCIYIFQQGMFIRGNWGRRSSFLWHNSCHRFHIQADSVIRVHLFYLKFWLHFVILLYLYVSKRKEEKAFIWQVHSVPVRSTLTRLSGPVISNVLSFGWISQDFWSNKRGSFIRYPLPGFCFDRDFMRLHNTTGTVVTLDTIIRNDANWIRGFDVSSSCLFFFFLQNCSFTMKPISDGSDSNQGSDYIAILVCSTSGFHGQNWKTLNHDLMKK